jgi:hypothetical protein
MFLFWDFGFLSSFLTKLQLFLIIHLKILVFCFAKNVYFAKMFYVFTQSHPISLFHKKSVYLYMFVSCISIIFLIFFWYLNKRVNSLKIQMSHCQLFLTFFSVYIEKYILEEKCSNFTNASCFLSTRWSPEIYLRSLKTVTLPDLLLYNW